MRPGALRVRDAARPDVNPDHVEVRRLREFNPQCELAAAALARAAATPVSTNVLLVIESPIISGFYG
jgi:hypothetical protein